jgi:hypothetical protein
VRLHLIWRMIAVGLGLGALPASGWSALVNGDFEAGDLTGWTTWGPAYARTFELARDFLAPIDPPWLAVEGEFFAALWSTDNAQSPTGGSQISQTFWANANDVLSFWYFFDSGKLVSMGRDTATVYLFAEQQPGQALLEINTPGHELMDDANIPWTSFSFALPAQGWYTLMFTVMDGAGGAFGFESIFGIDAVQVIPEPGSALLCLASLLFGTVACRRPAISGADGG